MDPAVFGKKLGEKIVSQTHAHTQKKNPSRILYTQRQIILVLFLGRNCSQPLALGGKGMFLSQGQQHLESGGGGVMKKHEREKQKRFTPNISPSAAGLLFFFFFFFF